MTAPRYEYDRLDLSRDAIRVVRLEGASPGTETLRCSLIQTFLLDRDGENDSGRIHYEALSYTWGDLKAPKKEILVDGCAMAVTTNLNSALRSLRQTEDRILWIDALCIDQRRNDEKMHQVGQMKLIYEQADTVLVWLGSECPASKALFPWMDKIQRKMNHRALSVEAVRKLYEADLEENEDISPSLLQDMVPQLFESPWFRRIWVIQEAASARRASIMFGRQKVKAQMFSIIVSLVGCPIPEGAQAVLDVMPGARNASSWWQNDRKLATLLHKFAKHHASDRRDMIFALLGIASDTAGSNFLQPDYNLSPEAVIATAMAFILNSDGSWTLGTHDLVDELRGWNLTDLCQPSAYRPEKLIRWALDNSRQFLIARMARERRVIGDINAPLTTEESPLLYRFAAPELWRGHSINEESARYLLEDPSIDVNVEYRGDTPLDMAVSTRNLTMVRLLLEKEGTNIHHVGSKGQTPMQTTWAVKGEGWIPEIMQLLMAHALACGEDSDSDFAKLELEFPAIGEWRYYSQKGFITRGIWTATFKGRVDLIRRYANEGADIEYQGRGQLGKNVVTPLGLAAQRGDLDVAEVLIELGAALEPSPSATDDEASPPCPPLWAAAQNGHMPMIKLLLGRGAKVDGLGWYSDSPFVPTAAQAPRPWKRRRLNSRAADSNWVGPYKTTPLFAAAVGGHGGAIKALMDAHADPLFRADDGMLAVEAADAGGHKHVADILGEASRRLSERIHVSKVPRV